MNQPTYIDPRARWIVRLVILGLLFLCGLVVFAVNARAHDHTRPELNGWLGGLHSKGGGLCCDGAEAIRLEDPDWDNDSGHYRVRINGVWVPVPDNAVIEEPNKFGTVLAWPIPDAHSPDGMSHDAVTGVIKIRCFLKGNES